ncbi:MAG: ester cyclase [Erythrobacter sp.]|jgi:predicted ester cyclase|nr:ester cyclase [Erythrobacter sp.]
MLEARHEIPKADIRRLLSDQIERIWGAGDVSLVDANYSATVRDHMPVPGQPSGREALKDVVREFRAGIPDLSMELHATLVAGDMGVDVWSLTGSHGSALLGRPASGRRIDISGIDMIRVNEGRITDLWHVEEMAQLIAQIDGQEPVIGAPPEAVPAALPLPATRSPGEGAYVPGQDSFSERERRNLAIARLHIEEIWAGGRAELCWELYHPEVIDHNKAPGQKPGIAGIVDVLQWLRASVPDLAMEIQCYVIDGDLVADRWIMTGTHTGAPLMGTSASAKRFTINGMDVARIDEDGLITEIWHAEEFHQLLAQVR